MAELTTYHIKQEMVEMITIQLWTAPRTDTNQCHRHVPYNIAKSMHTNLQSDVSKYDPLD
jgi:hypothetical protein